MAESGFDFAGAKILAVDDTPANLDILTETLEGAGYAVLAATNGAAALGVAAREKPDLVLLDIMMPGMDGVETCRRLKADEACRDIPVIFVTVENAAEQIITCFRAGGADYVVKPFRKEEILARVRSQLARVMLERELARKNEQLEQSLREAERANEKLQAEIAAREALDSRLASISEREAQRWGIEGFVGRSSTMQKILRDIALLKNANAVSVLITGESGTGKELIARAIHAGSDRARRPLVAVNCAAIPAELAESLLFGHLAGAFTGAKRDQTGYFDLADGGTLFLDEVGTMPEAVQPKLLRVLEDGFIRPLGAKRDRRVDVRVLAATNAGPEALRSDLYYRLARFTVEVPPLRERKDDISLLAGHFLKLFAADMGIAPPKVNAAALNALMAYDFPGNVRELKNLVERALIESGGGVIQPAHLHIAKLQTPSTPEAPSETSILSLQTLPLNFAEAEVMLIRRAVDLAGGNVSQAARRLGIDRNKIYRKLNQDKSAPEKPDRRPH
jgi:DNA-binding NtrC family response regulator